MSQNTPQGPSKPRDQSKVIPVVPRTEANKPTQPSVYDQAVQARRQERKDIRDQAEVERLERITQERIAKEQAQLEAETAALKEAKKAAEAEKGGW